MSAVRLFKRFILAMAEESVEVPVRQQFGVNGCPAHHNLEVALDKSRGAFDRNRNPAVILQWDNLACVIRAAQIDRGSRERQRESEPARNQDEFMERP